MKSFNIKRRPVGFNKTMYLILAESELELIPGELLNHPQVRGFARYTHKNPSKTLLDSAEFFKAQMKLKDGERRGRPDLIHAALILALDSPACRRRELQVIIHTRENRVIIVNPDTRIPKNYKRFVGLIEQLFENGRVPPTGEALLSMEREMTLPELVESLNPKRTIVFDAGGTLVKLPDELRTHLEPVDDAVVIIGGFPHGPFRQVKDLKKVDETISVSEHELLAATAVAFIITALGG